MPIDWLSAGRHRAFIWTIVDCLLVRSSIPIKNIRGIDNKIDI